MDRPRSAETSERPDVFICYAHEDSGFVYPEIAWLQAHGVSVWYDEGISAGANWRATIGNALLAAPQAFFFISRNSLRSDHCNREINLALDEGKQVVPIYLEEVELTSDLKIGLNRLQAIHTGTSSVSEYRARLLAALGTQPPLASGLAIGHRPRRRTQLLLALVGVIVVTLGVAGSWWIVERDADITTATIASVAVLPFDGIALDPESQWLTHGVASDLTQMLAAIPRLRVASQRSAVALHDSGRTPSAIGEELRVDAVLGGSIQRADEQIEVTTELVRTTDDEVLWRETFTAPLAEPQQLQSRLAARVFNYFGSQLSKYHFDRPKGAEAYRAHLKRLAYFLSSNTTEELKWAEMVTALEPDYAMGHVNRVFPYLYAALADPLGPWSAKARSALDTAARLGIADTSAYKAHEGLYQWVFEGNLDEAEQLLRDAFLDGDEFGGIWYALLLASSGVHEPALAFYERLTLTEPYFSLNWGFLADQLAYAGAFEDAAAALNKSLELIPDDYFAFESRALIYSLAGEEERAREDLERLREDARYPPFRLAYTEASIRLRNGDVDFARSVAQELAAQGMHLWAAGLYLRAHDPRADKEFAAAAALPQWAKYWTGGYAWRTPAQLRSSRSWRSFEEALGYTVAWRLEICLRASRLPPESGLGCDPASYE